MFWSTASSGAAKQGYAGESDWLAIEQRGKIHGADPDQVSAKVFERGRDQLGTLGSGNHYLEIEVVKPENVFEPEIAKTFGIDRPNQIVILIHCGSRGCGHQVATDHLQVFNKAMPKYGIKTNDRELACAPFDSPEGQSYFKAMTCAANSAFANRQVIVHNVRKAFVEVLGKPEHLLGLQTIYDVAHNIAKVETYEINGKKQKVIVHRKGATRAFGPNSPDVPEKYRAVGQPVLVGGSMQTGSYLLVGTTKAMEETYGSTLHGSGRTMSRAQAKKMVRGSELISEMADQGIQVRAASLSGLAEEVGFAYKEIDDVINAVHDIGISRKVAKLVPMGISRGRALTPTPLPRERGDFGSHIIGKSLAGSVRSTRGNPSLSAASSTEDIFSAVFHRRRARVCSRLARHRRRRCS